MGNKSSSRTEDWDSNSDDGGGSDYEHAYDYHTSVLHKGPADGFESDYEDEDDTLLTGGRRLRALPACSVSTADTSAASASSTFAVVKPDDDGNKDGARTAEKSSAPVEQKRDSTEKGHPRQVTHSSEEGHPGQVSWGRDAAQESDCCAQVPDQTARSDPTVGLDTLVQHSGQISDGQTPALTPVSSPTSGRSRQQQQAPPPNRSIVKPDARGDRSHVEGEGDGLRGAKEEETYETAGEGSGEEGVRGGVSDDGSLSTITPPRTRPQSDSEFTVSEESSEDNHSGSESVEEEEEEEEEENEGGESDYDTERVTSHTSRTLVKQRETQMSRSRARTRSNPPAADYRPSETSQRRLPRRQEMSPKAYRLARKRPPSPKQSPSKRSRPSDGINFSPNRTRFGIFESGSESDNAASRREGRKRRAAQPPLSSPPTKTALEGMSLSARTLRQAARQAASQFVETSRKILRDAKTAARILRESTSKRRSSSHLEEEDGPSMGKKPSLEERETRTSTRIYETRRSERIAGPRQSTDSGPSSARRGAAKRKLQNPGSPRDRRKRQQRTPSESDSDLEINDSHQTRSASWRQVRKDGGRLRKFTRNSAATSPQSSTRRSPRLSLLVPVSSASLPMLPGTGNASATPSQSPARNTRLNNSFPSAMGSSNPFQNVTLRPSPSKATPTGSIDSISHELGGGHQWPSPFSSLLTDSGRGEDPQVLTLSGGSVWARISARTSSNVSAQNLKPGHEQGHASPVPGPSGGSSTRMATRTSPEVAAADYPAHSTPRVPSLTLTGQFAQSGRFAFLLENVLQVTVVTNDITTSTTNAIVVTTDGHLHHRGPAAQSVAKSAGSGFAQACRDFLRRNPRGLQVCEVLDTPAGGRLPALISHILHVVVPQETDASSSTTASCGIQQRKMLLCTYINCLKHASEKLGLPSLGLPLIGADTCSADECIQVFFDSLLVYLAERTPDCPLHALQLLITHPALARFTAEVLESRLQALKTSSVDVAMAAVFKEYFNVPEFTRSNNNNASGGGGGGFSPLQVSGERSPSGKPAVKRRRL